MRNPPNADPLWTHPAWLRWVEARPKNIQDAIYKYPPGAKLLGPGDEVLWVVGWAEQQASDEVTIIFSTIDPFEDYDAAHLPKNRRYVCAHHLEPIVEH